MRRPNLILVVVDDMGFGDFGRFSRGASRTPVLDQLMAESTTLMQHYAASPVCAPARAALLTGRYPQRAGVIDTLEARGTDRLSLRETTLADELAAAGYRTGLVGKWHNGTLGGAYHPNARGFQEFVGFRGGWQDYWQWRIEKDGVRITADGRYLTDVFAAEAAAFVDRHAAAPFFLHVAFNAPHYPFQAPDGLIEEFRRDGRSEVVATIYAMIAAMDRGVGAILDALDRNGLAEDTIIAFTSDNGPQLDLAEGGPAQRYNYDLAGEKLYVWEGGIRLPFILRWPARIPAGRSSDAFVHTTDWLPTFLELLDLPRAGRLPLDGRSVATALTGGRDAADAERFWQWTRYAPTPVSNAAMRSGPWKLVVPALPETMGFTSADRSIDEEIKVHPERFPAPLNSPVPDYSPLEPAPPQLFDLASDPGETSDLAADHPERVRAMSARLAAWFEDVERERLSLAD